MKHGTMTCIPLRLGKAAPQGLPVLYVIVWAASSEMVIAVLMSPSVLAIVGIVCVRGRVLPICYQMLICKKNNATSTTLGEFIFFNSSLHPH